MRSGNHLSSYLFDIDDNILFSSTTITIFEDLPNPPGGSVRKGVKVSTTDFAHLHPFIKPDKLSLYTIDEESFLRFRDDPNRKTDEQLAFVEDLETALDTSETAWQGPSWEMFKYATENGRPVSFVTARGHSPETIKEGIKLLHKRGHIDKLPNYQGVFPVTNSAVQEELSEGQSGLEVPELKRRAIRKIVRETLTKHPENSHSFGMSDDDPSNVRLIHQAMRELKEEHPTCRFFVINTSHDPLIKTEIQSADPVKGMVPTPVAQEEKAAALD